MRIPSTARDPWFHREARGPVRARLFCLPPAGAGAQFFRGWGASLPEGVELMALRLPGREGRSREPAIQTLDALLPPLADAIAAHTEVPYAFYGHSMGSWLSIVLSERFRHTGQSMPRGLIVSGRRPPHLATDRPPMHTLDDDALWDHLRDIGGLHPRVWKEAELKPLLLPAVRADLTLVERTPYDGAESPLGVRIHVLHATEDPMLDRAQMSAWADRSTRPLTTTDLPGAHFFMNDDPEAFRAALGRVVGEMLG